MSKFFGNGLVQFLLAIGIVVMLGSWLNDRNKARPEIDTVQLEESAGQAVLSYELANPGKAEALYRASLPLDFQRTGNTFGGFDCKSDCSGHIAGWGWAISEGVSDEDECPTSSESFYEGCLAQVRAAGN